MIIDLSQYDFRLADLSGELFALEDHLHLIEDQMEHIQETERSRVETQLRRDGLSPKEPEWHQALDEYTYRVECLLPRIFRGTFLVALYAVYESAVTEIADLVQKKQSEQISINDLRGNFLERAKKYYRHILKFDLYTKENIWYRLKMLSELRNAFAHTNGRLEMLSERPRKIIQKWVRQRIGVTTCRGYIVCEASFVSDLFVVVRDSLEDLMARYKHRDDVKTNS